MPTELHVRCSWFKRRAVVTRIYDSSEILVTAKFKFETLLEAEVLQRRSVTSRIESIGVLRIHFGYWSLCFCGLGNWVAWKMFALEHYKMLISNLAWSIFYIFVIKEKESFQRSLIKIPKKIVQIQTYCIVFADFVML